MLDDQRIIDITPDLPQRCQVGPAALSFKAEILERARETFDAHRDHQPFAFPENGFDKAIAPEIETAFCSRFGRPGNSHLIFTATAGDRLLGYIRLNEAARQDGPGHPVVRIEDLWVSPEARGRGLGGLLLAYVLALGERRGWDNLEAAVHDGHDRLRALLMSAGFDQQSETLRFGPRGPARALPDTGPLAALNLPNLSLLVVPVLGISAAVGTLILVLVALLA